MKIEYLKEMQTWLEINGEIKHGVNDLAIKEVEKEYGVSFPVAYKEFLYLNGQNFSPVNYENCEFNWCRENIWPNEKSWLAQECLEITRPYWVLGESRGSITFFYLDEGNDPTVWRCDYKGRMQYKDWLWKITDSFNEYVDSLIEYYEKDNGYSPYSRFCLNLDSAVRRLLQLEKKPQWLMDIKYLKKAEEYVRKNFPLRIGKVSEDKILELEAKWNVKFPKAFKEMLYLSGGHFEPIHFGLEYLEENVWPNEKSWLSEKGMELEKPYWVIGEDQGIDFFYLDEGDNPPVWRCDWETKAMFEDRIWKASDSLSNYIKLGIKIYEENKHTYE